MNWPDWLKVLDIKPRFSFGVWLFGTILIVLPLRALEYLALDNLVQSYRPWISLFTIAFFILWVVQLAPWQVAASLYAERRLKKDFKNVLDTLSPDERTLLAYSISRKKQTVHLDMTNPVATALRAKGFMQVVPGIVDYRFVPYAIHGPIWKLLNENKFYLLTEEHWNDPAVEKLFSDIDEQLETNARRLRSWM